MASKTDAMMSDYLTITPAGTSWSSLPFNYNSCARSAANLVEGAAFHAIRAEETYAGLIHGETQ
jgi:hypothetical protein